MRVIPSIEPYEEAQLIPSTPVLVSYRGSIAHGMHNPHDEGGIDDIDLMAVYIPPLSQYFGIARALAKGHDVKLREWDVAAYELRHYTHLLCQANPNVMASLWLKPEMYLRIERAGQALIDNRKAFLSLRAYYSFVGYAHGQLKRMTAYHEQGEDACCEGQEYHSEGCKLRESRGRGSVKKYATGFMGAKRKALVEQFGYDTKNAAHCIRLLRMGCDLLITGALVVDRRDAGDAHELLAIKHGEWSLAEVQEEADDLFNQMEKYKDKTNLPEEPNMRVIESMLIEQLSHWHGAAAATAAQAMLMRDNPPPLGYRADKSKEELEKLTNG